MGKDEKLAEYEYSKVPTQQIIAEKQEIPSHYEYGVRHIQLLICFLCLMVNFVGRGHMGVTVVSMTSPAKHNAVLDVKLTEQSNFTNIQHVAVEDLTTEDIYGNFTVNESINGTALVNSTENYHKCDWKAVCACRIAQGLSHAGVFHSIQTLLAKWVPVSERGTLTSYVYVDT